MSVYSKSEHDEAIEFIEGKRKRTKDFDKVLYASVLGILRESRDAGATCSEAGRKGGLVNRDMRGHDFYVEIGRKGGHKVRDLIAAGKRAAMRGG